jgi:hypothetical protein
VHEGHALVLWDTSLMIWYRYGYGWWYGISYMLHMVDALVHDLLFLIDVSLVHDW